LLLLCEAGTAKDLSILAAQLRWFKRQCDCFVTKRLAGQWFALKEVTKKLRRSNSVYGEYRVIAVEHAVKMREGFLTQRRNSAAKIFYFALRRCDAA
jgi:hypothetical protein